MLRKVLIFMCAICTLNCWATNVHWGNTIITTCESGDDITVPTEEPTPQIGYHFVGWKKFIRIEYLKSTGTQYIDSGFRPNQDTRVLTKIENYSPNGTFAYHSYNYDNGIMYGFAFNSGGTKNFRDDYGLTGKTKGQQITVSTQYGIHIIDKNKNITNVIRPDGTIAVVEHTYHTFSPPHNMTFFAGRNDKGIVLKASDLKIYYLQIYDNSVLVRNFIAGLDGDNVPCMYDTVNGKLYYNSGTGDFITEAATADTNIYVGNDIVQNACNNEDVYFYPVFEPNTIDIYWDDGTDIKQTQCTYGMPIINVPDDPVRPGYKFGGWRIKKNN